VRNSLLVEHFRAENERDSSMQPKLQECIAVALHSVGERSTSGWRETETTPGRSRSDSAGISSDKRSEKLLRRKPKVSWGRQLRPGLVGA